MLFHPRDWLRKAARVFFLLGLAMGPQVACGKLVGVEYFDLNQVNGGVAEGGPLWRGVVDTALNQLSITYWDELPRFGLDFFEPLGAPDLSADPLVWPAVTSDSDGNLISFDVPDDFGAGGVVSIGSDWGFVSTLLATEIEYENGEFSVVPAADFQPGWGAVVRIPTGGTEFELDASDDETVMPFWPRIATAEIDTFDRVDGAQVRVVPLSVIGIPEPTPGLVFGLIATGASARGRRRKR